MFHSNPIVQYYAGLSQMELNNERKIIRRSIQADEKQLRLLVRSRDSGEYTGTQASQRIAKWVQFLQEEEAKLSVIEDMLKDEHENIEMCHG